MSDKTRAADVRGGATTESTRAPERPGFVLSGSWRLYGVALFIGLLASVLAVRLLELQVFLWAGYIPPVQAGGARYTVDDDTPWGNIVDRDGVLLAADRFTYRVTATPANIQDDEDRIQIAQILETVAQIPAAQTLERLRADPESRYALLAKDLPFELGEALLQEKARWAKEDVDLLFHVHVFPHPRRFYPQGKLASQVIGFLNGERKPVLGLERYYGSFLAASGVGLPPGNQVSRDVLPPEVLRFLPPGEGKGLVLTLDRTIQWIIEEELAEGVRFYGAEGGSIIVLDPKTGAVLGMANYPSFDPNTFELVQDEALFRNRTISDHYEPGSIFKVITVAAALDAGVVEPTTIFTDTGTITLGERVFLNSNRLALGQLTVADALAQSNNVVTVQIAEALGSEKFYDYVARFGFGADTNIDLSGEAPGIVKRPGDERWSLSDLAANSFGQGIAVTPLQMASAVAAIANDGKLMRPYVVQARVQGDQALLTEPTVAQQPIRPETAATMRELMVHVVETGNQAAKVPGYTVAGKSGTAEISTEEGYVLERTIASFVGFAPADDPRIVVLVKLDKPDPSISRWAAHTAAPLFSRVTHRLLDHLNVPPDAVRVANR
ncbi:MAG: penicillin-binding protein 2 [Caldilineae bacterium]|nr:MAG: penicillin-binding protein 2 [Caldilineae bacterium]